MTRRLDDSRDPEDVIADRETARHDERDADRQHERWARRMVEPSRGGCLDPNCDRTCE